MHGACKNVRYPENNCSNFFYHNGPHIDPDKDRWRLCVAPSGAEACLRMDWCKAYEWFPLPPALLPSGAPCELHRDYPVQAAEDCGETGASSLAHCCCVRLPGPSE
ncbi:hypothetical protein EMIHUDRAFT_217155 [Emiliania huxleyi CCMP1516]|uniref:Uncharacterized protein n=2 Tax=Emiliania huxleyi TaxID=2903 RepID=A0A0D3IC70_EMIH1|nr:hypothetical protein EMIHUDRAFT_217155 [Emiliania huxleyi CCMP1516]EOD08855.1 hypothetical protein EMIHUDRAFT_217155 [Emiliania huxleyi CCMP1516]|eukprot:XP_005761284.1 hypothetical protein EMIHUDRAFT_217155 [Emiliania huxleyi CCMP1516]